MARANVSDDDDDILQDGPDDCLDIRAEVRLRPDSSDEYQANRSHSRVADDADIQDDDDDDGLMLARLIKRAEGLRDEVQEEIEREPTPPLTIRPGVEDTAPTALQPSVLTAHPAEERK